MIEIFELVAKAVSDASRIRILKLLEAGELCVCQITTVLDLAPATVSKHLAHLKAAGLLQQRRDGKWIYYRLAERPLNAYAQDFLAVLARGLGDDPTLAEDRRLLALVSQQPVSVICDQGRAALSIPASSNDPSCCGEKP